MISLDDLIDKKVALMVKRLEYLSITRKVEDSILNRVFFSSVIVDHFFSFWYPNEPGSPSSHTMIIIIIIIIIIIRRRRRRRTTMIVIK